MRSYLLSDVVLCAIVITSLTIGVLIGSFAGHTNKLGPENDSLVTSSGGALSNIEEKNNSLAIGKSKNSIKNMTIIPPRIPKVPINIFDQNDFKHIFSVDTYYKKSKYAFKEYYWTDITEILGGGFFNASKESDCGEKAAFAEWLLRRHGINASIVAADKFPGMNCSHAWVKVKTPLNETIFIDLSQSQANGNDTGYIKIGDDYKHFDREFKDVFEAESSYSDSCSSCEHHFGWWETDWGKLKLKSLGLYDNETITVAGSAAIFPIADAEAKAFNSQRNGCRVNLNGGSNSECIAAIAENISDIALTSREVTKDEKKEYGDNFKQFNIGLEGRIVVVSKSIYQAGIKELTREQLRNIVCV